MRFALGTVNAEDHVLLPMQHMLILSSVSQFHISILCYLHVTYQLISILTEQRTNSRLPTTHPPGLCRPPRLSRARCLSRRILSKCRQSGAWSPAAGSHRHAGGTAPEANNYIWQLERHY